LQSLLRQLSHISIQASVTSASDIRVKKVKRGNFYYLLHTLLPDLYYVAKQTL
jgi:hypothetical protein